MDERIDFLESVLDRFVAVMATAGAGDTTLPTPCEDYDVAALLEHIAVWAPLFATAVRGEPAPHDPTTHRVGEGWDRIVAEAGAAVVEGFRSGGLDRMVTLTASPLPAGFLLDMLLLEYVAHGWDLSAAIGIPAPYTDAEIEAALASGRTILAPEYRGTGMFDAEIPVPVDAPAMARLVGFLGRDPGIVPVA